MGQIASIIRKEKPEASETSRAPLKVKKKLGKKEWKYSFKKEYDVTYGEDSMMEIRELLSFDTSTCEEQLPSEK